MKNLSIKQELYNQCQTFITVRLEAIQKTISEIQISLTSETKSSAGDKHETGRAMLQLEREKAGEQLAQIQKLNQILSKVDVSKVSNSISLGSVVFTTKLNYFMAVSAGALNVEGEVFYAISANTPMGKLLIGKQKGDQINFRGEQYEIINII